MGELDSSSKCLHSVYNWIRLILLDFKNIMVELNGWIFKTINSACLLSNFIA